MELERDRMISRQHFQERYHGYKIILQTPYFIVGQNTQKSNDFAALEFHLPHFPEPTLGNLMSLYSAGFVKGVMDIKLPKQDLGDVIKEYFFEHGLADGKEFRDSRAKTV